MRNQLRIVLALAAAGLLACSSSSGSGGGWPYVPGYVPPGTDPGAGTGTADTAQPAGQVDPGGGVPGVDVPAAGDPGTQPPVDGAGPGVDPGATTTDPGGGTTTPDGSTTTPDPGATQDTGPVTVEIPDTPVGEQLRWVLAIVAGEAYPSLTEVRRRFSRSAYPEVSSEDLRDYLYSWRDDTGPWSLEGFEQPMGAHSLVVRLQTSDRWRRLYLAVEEEATTSGGEAEDAPSDAPPADAETWHAIKNIYLRGAPDLDPQLGGPIADTQLGLRVVSPWFGGDARIAPVELVDRHTGQPFDPPRKGVTDGKYGYVRLDVPAGVEVGVRVSLTNDLTTFNYDERYRGGEDMVFVAAFPRVSVSEYLGAAGLEPQEGKAHVWGYVEYDASDNAFELDKRWTVGCATASLSPETEDLFYTSYNPERFKNLPDPNRKNTNPQNGTFWALNLEPVRHVITAQAGHYQATTELPPLQPGTFTLAVVTFGRDEVPQNPTPEGCDQASDDSPER